MVSFVNDNFKYKYNDKYGYHYDKDKLDTKEDKHKNDHCMDTGIDDGQNIVKINTIKYDKYCVYRVYVYTRQEFCNVNHLFTQSQCASYYTKYNATISLLNHEYQQIGINWL